MFFKTKLLLRQLPGCRYAVCNYGKDSKEMLKKVLIVSKLTRLEFEKSREKDITDDRLQQKLKERGSDYDAMRFYHFLHKELEHKVAQSFQHHGVEVKVVNRLNINKEILNWADMLVPVGGDGTFLLAAGRASPFFLETKKKIPVVGFNSDPRRSEGRLMLPKQYTTNIDEAVERILNGKFKWMERSRIRVTLVGESTEKFLPIDLHEYNISPVEHKDVFVPILQSGQQLYMNRILPYLALNEVFIGETLSARVSHLHIQLDNSDKITKTKNSGLCVSTGTGSTSWLTSINRLSTQNVTDLIEILKESTGTKDLNNVCPETISEEYNQRLIFPPDDPRLCYSIREQICLGVWPNPKGLESRGFAKSVFVKSRCIDASLVIDGSIAYNFNDGASAHLEVHPEDALLTIAMD